MRPSDRRISSYITLVQSAALVLYRRAMIAGSQVSEMGEMVLSPKL